jgi:hypothetical protein
MWHRLYYVLNSDLNTPMAGKFDDESLQYLLQLSSYGVQIAEHSSSQNELGNETGFDLESEEYLKEIAGHVETSEREVGFDSDSLLYLQKLVDSNCTTEEGLSESSNERNYEVNEGLRTGEVLEENLTVNVERANENPRFLSQKRQVCSQYCASKCTSVWESWTKDEREVVEQMLSGKTKLQQKNYLLEHLKKQKGLGIRKSGFHFNGHTFCLKACSTFSGCSEFILKQVIQDYHSNLVEYVHGNKSGTRMSSATVHFIVWMKHFGLQFGQFSPDELVTVIPAHWTKKSIYDKYCGEVVGKVIKKSAFYSLFVSKFGHLRLDKTLPWIRISFNSTHSICDKCLALNQYRRGCTTKDQISYVQALMYKHKEAYGRSRIVIGGLRQSALSYPADLMMIMLDDMDNQKSFVPRILERGKKLSGLNTLPSKVTGTITWSGLYEGGRKVKYYLNHNQFPQNGNKTISVIFLLLKDFVSQFKKLPKVLIVNCDNCWR